MQNPISNDENKDIEKKKIDVNIRPQMCAKSPILDPISKRDNEYMEALNSINNMTKRKRKLDKEESKGKQVINPQDKFTEAFEMLSKGLDVKRKVEERCKR